MRSDYLIKRSGTLHVYSEHQDEWVLIDDIPLLMYNHLQQSDLELTQAGELFVIPIRQVATEAHTDFNRTACSVTPLQQLFHLNQNQYIGLRKNNQLVMIKLIKCGLSIECIPLLSDIQLIVREANTVNKFIFLDTDNQWNSLIVRSTPWSSDRNIKRDNPVVHQITKPKNLPLLSEIVGYRDGLLWTAEKLWVISFNYSTVPVTVVNSFTLDTEIIDAVIINHHRKINLYLLTKSGYVEMSLDDNYLKNRLTNFDDQYLRMIDRNWTELIQWKNQCCVIADDGSGTILNGVYIAPLDLLL